MMGGRDVSDRPTDDTAHRTVTTPSLTHTHSSSCLDMSPARRRHWLERESASLPGSSFDVIGRSIPDIVVHPATAASNRDSLPYFDWPPVRRALLSVPIADEHARKQRTHSDSALYERTRVSKAGGTFRNDEMCSEPEQSATAKRDITPPSDGGEDSSPKVSWLRRHSDSFVGSDAGGGDSRESSSEPSGTERSTQTPPTKTDSSTAPKMELKLKRYLQRRYQQSLEAMQASVADDEVFAQDKTEVKTEPAAASWDMCLALPLPPHLPPPPHSASPRCQRSVFHFADPSDPSTQKAANTTIQAAKCDTPLTDLDSFRRRYDATRTHFNFDDAIQQRRQQDLSMHQRDTLRHAFEPLRHEMEPSRRDLDAPSHLFSHLMSRFHHPFVTMPRPAWPSAPHVGGGVLVKRECTPDTECFACVVCGQAFASYTHLTSHMAKHLDVATQRPAATASSSGSSSKTHPCLVCGRAFARSDMLTRHARLHTGAKPYACHSCGQVFSRSDHLRTHARTHTGERPYACPRCTYAAPRRDMITRHMRVHAKSWARRAARRNSSPAATSDRRKKYSLSSVDSGESEEPSPTTVDVKHQAALATRPRNWSAESCESALSSPPAESAWAYMGWGAGRDSPLSPSARSTDSASGEVQRSLQRCSMASDSSPSGSDVALSPARLQLSPSIASEASTPGRHQLTDVGTREVPTDRTEGTYFKYHVPK